MQTYIIANGKSRTVLKESKDENEAILFICKINKGSEHLKVFSTFDSFEVDDTLDDGLYVIKENTFVRVYKLESLKLDGYLYSSVYKTRKVAASYELVQGDKTLI